MKTSDYDPVCGVVMDIDEGFSSTYRGVTYMFCCDSCKEEFDANPECYAVEVDEDEDC